MIVESVKPALQPGVSRRYSVYGITVESEIPLALPTAGALGSGTGDVIQIQRRSRRYFTNAMSGIPVESDPDSFYHVGIRDDGASYACWEGVGEFLVSADGHRIGCHASTEATHESFQVYVLGQALSFALVQKGFEPLHSTVVELDGEAIAFLGQSGSGKSTLAAAFLASGHRILTDDLLLVRTGDDGPQAFPGPARLKLLPETAQRILPDAEGVRMNPDTQKMIIPLVAEQTVEGSRRLRAVYVLGAPEEEDETRPPRRIEIRPLSQRDAFLELVRGTFNQRIQDRRRLERQLGANTELAAAVPMFQLEFPRRWETIPTIRERVTAHARALAGAAG